MHPSLNAKFEFPTTLVPQEKMGRNELCWCGSGKKWKKCHKERHLQKEIPIGQLLNEMHQSEIRGTCLHPDASKQNCSRQTIKAHTVQRAGGLRAIAEDGHVISVKKGVEKIFENQGNILPKPLGIGSASTFNGFCATHDNLLFEPIENKAYSLDHESAFLLSFRAIAYEYLTKKDSIKGIEIQRKLDKGKDFQTQIAIQQHLHSFLSGLLRGMRDLANWKAEYDKKFYAKDYTSMPHYAVEFDGLLPFVCCGGFHPEVDFNGNQLQRISRGNFKFEHVCVNISVMDKKTFLVFGWHGAKDGPAEIFVKSFQSIKDSEKANTALILAVEQSENTYFNPSWWNALSKTNRNHLIKRMGSGTGLNAIRSKDIYRNMVKILSKVTISTEVGIT